MVWGGHAARFRVGGADRGVNVAAPAGVSTGIEWTGAAGPDGYADQVPFGCSGGLLDR